MPNNQEIRPIVRYLQQDHITRPQPLNFNHTVFGLSIRSSHYLISNPENKRKEYPAQTLSLFSIATARLNASENLGEVSCYDCCTNLP